MSAFLITHASHGLYLSKSRNWKKKNFIYTFCPHFVSRICLCKYLRFFEEWLENTYVPHLPWLSQVRGNFTPSSTSIYGKFNSTQKIQFRARNCSVICELIRHNAVTNELRRNPTYERKCISYEACCVLGVRRKLGKNEVFGHFRLEKT